MFLLLRRAAEAYSRIVVDTRDLRTHDWPFMSSPFVPITIVALYVWFVKYKGPELMQDRKAFNLKWVLVVFNAMQVILNLYLFILSITLAYGFGPFSYRCEPVDYSRSDRAMMVAFGCYLYYVIKLLDLLDTIFYVLRKKDRQISFLHVYHHGGMVLITYGGVAYFAGGNSVFIGLLNTWVHVVMYSYYLITALSPKYKNKLWWKKHLTQMQMVQFLLIILHTSQLIWEECGYPRWVVFILVPQNLFMLGLFLDFYLKNYGSSEKTGGKSTADGANLVTNKGEKSRTKSNNSHSNEIKEE